jgi:hypothetical protein
MADSTPAVASASSRPVRVPGTCPSAWLLCVEWISPSALTPVEVPGHE